MAAILDFLIHKLDFLVEFVFFVPIFSNNKINDSSQFTDVTSMSEDQVTEFRESNNKIVVTNFNPDSADVILKPTPAFHHAFHNHPGILETISSKSCNEFSNI